MRQPILARLSIAAKPHPECLASDHCARNELACVPPKPGQDPIDLLRASALPRRTEISRNCVFIDPGGGFPASSPDVGDSPLQIDGRPGDQAA